MAVVVKWKRVGVRSVHGVTRMQHAHPDSVCILVTGFFLHPWVLASIFSYLELPNMIPYDTLAANHQQQKRLLAAVWWFIFWFIFALLITANQD